MPKTKAEKIESIDKEIEQLENRRKLLIQAQKEQERKERTSRLIQRGAILESLIGSADTLTGEQIKVFLKKTITTPFALRELDNIKAQTSTVPAGKEGNMQEEAG